MSAHPKGRLIGVGTGPGDPELLTLKAVRALEAADVPASRLFDVADCANDPHFRARGAVLPVDDPLIGATLHPGPAIRLDGDPPEAAIGWTGPALGAHTRYVLDTLLAAAPPR